VRTTVANAVVERRLAALSLRGHTTTRIDIISLRAWAVPRPRDVRLRNSLSHRTVSPRLTAGERRTTANMSRIRRPSPVANAARSITTSAYTGSGYCVSTTRAPIKTSLVLWDASQSVLPEGRSLETGAALDPGVDVPLGGGRSAAAGPLPRPRRRCSVASSCSVPMDARCPPRAPSSGVLGVPSPTGAPATASSSSMASHNNRCEPHVLAVSSGTAVSLANLDRLGTIARAALAPCITSTPSAIDVGRPAKKTRSRPG
jgi:hypothetical protein